MGFVGIALLALLIAVAVLFPYIGNEEGIKNWRNYEYWSDYPKKAPPCWAVRGSFPTQIVSGEQEDSYTFEVFEMEGYRVNSYSIPFEVSGGAPVAVNLKFSVKYNATTYVFLSLQRPDGLQVNLTSSYEDPSLTTMRSVFGVSSSSYSGIVQKNLVAYVNNPQVASAYLRKWLNSIGIQVTSTTISVLSNKGFLVLLSKAGPDMVDRPEVLEGAYTLRVDFISKDPELQTRLESVSFLGNCYGVLGTDVYGRDLLQGVLYGVRWALIIGILVAFASTMAGGLYGVVSGYFGGVLDEIMLRVAQIVYSIPVLPLLIILSYMLKPSIWNLVALLIVFGWPGVALVTRSMTLQLKEETYVEAARAFGASHARIIFKYILPQTLPYLFATMALSVPSAILTEASVSFLGLGDPTKITWGRILNEANANMATVNGYWWWVIPPGLMIMVAGTTFIFIGYALDSVLNPRLKR